MCFSYLLINIPTPGVKQQGVKKVHSQDRLANLEARPTGRLTSRTRRDPDICPVCPHTADGTPKLQMGKVMKMQFFGQKICEETLECATMSR